MRKLFVLVLIFLLAAKIAAIGLRGPVSIEMDAAEYWRLSTSAMSGDGFLFDHPIAYRTPVYPWFLALMRLAFGPHSLAAITITQAMMSLASIWIAGRLAANITGFPRALPITLLVSLPAISALTFNAAILSETLFVFLLMLNFAAVERYSRQATVLSSIWVGVTFAATLLTRPIVMLLWIPHVLFALLNRFVKSRHPVRITESRGGAISIGIHFAIAGLTVILLVGPWVMRNQFLFGKPFITEFVGRNLWVVTFQDGSGSGFDIPDTQAGRMLMRRLDRVGMVDNRESTWAVCHALTASGLNDAQADQLMKQVSLDAIQADQKRFVIDAMRRVINFWRTRATQLPDPRDEGQFWGQSTWRYDVPGVEMLIQRRASNVLWLNGLVLVIIIAANVVLIVHSPSRSQGIWLAMCLAYFAIITGVLEIPAYRYRMVNEPLAASVIGAATAVLLSKRTKKSVIVGAGN